jgi:hypothetical protein
VLLPSQRDRHASEGQVDIGDDWAVFHPGPAATSRARQSRDLLLDGDLAHGSLPRIREDADVFQANEMLGDLASIGEHRGAEDLFSHRSRLKRLCD